MEIIDLSTQLEAGMVRYPSPYLPDVQLVPAATHEREARSVHVLTCGTHVSTHIDAPFHVIPNGKTVDQIPLWQLFGPARLIRIFGRDKLHPIQVTDLESFGDLSLCKKLVIDTGWSRRMWGTKAYFTEGPHLTPEVARYLAKLPRLHLIGMDFPNVDPKEHTVVGKPAPNHQILLGRDIVLLENLVQLEKVDEEFLLSTAPVRLVGGDGCPCRAIAIFPLREIADWAKIG